MKIKLDVFNKTPTLLFKGRECNEFYSDNFLYARDTTSNKIYDIEEHVFTGSNNTNWISFTSCPNAAFYYTVIGKNVGDTVYITLWKNLNAIYVPSRIDPDSNAMKLSIRDKEYIVNEKVPLSNLVTTYEFKIIKSDLDWCKSTKLNINFNMMPYTRWKELLNSIDPAYKYYFNSIILLQDEYNIINLKFWNIKKYFDKYVCIIENALNIHKLSISCIVSSLQNFQYKDKIYIINNSLKYSKQLYETFEELKETISKMKEKLLEDIKIIRTNNSKHINLLQESDVLIVSVNKKYNYFLNNIKNKANIKDLYDLTILMIDIFNTSEYVTNTSNEIIDFANMIQNIPDNSNNELLEWSISYINKLSPQIRNSLNDILQKSGEVECGFDKKIFRYMRRMYCETAFHKLQHSVNTSYETYKNMKNKESILFFNNSINTY